MFFLRIPAATYRLQFNRDFRLPDALKLVPYLSALGISDLYASPLFAARPGSAHGYDVVDPTRLNPELGGESAFFALAAALKEANLGLLLDIVPNHMAADVANKWWADVLENGPFSPFAGYFDINWRPPRPGMKNKVLLPVLGKPYGEALENQELTLDFGRDGFRIKYHEHRLPLNLRAYHRILNRRGDELQKRYGADEPWAVQLLALGDRLKKSAPEAKSVGPEVKAVLWRLFQENEECKKFIEEDLQIFNGRKGDPESFRLLDRLLREQFYRLSFWRAANQEINYRRFFDISELVSLRMEQRKVFAATHSLVLELCKGKWVTGLRIDHVDGLYDPPGYLRRLQNALAGAKKRPAFYVIVEKILSGDEELPADWPVFGTTGYDFLNVVNTLFIDPDGIKELDELSCRWGEQEETGPPDLVYVQKKRVLKELFAAEAHALAQQAGRLAVRDRHGRDLTIADLEQGIFEITACLPVYRTYLGHSPAAGQDREKIEYAVAEAGRRNPNLLPAVAFLRRVLLQEYPAEFTPAQKKEWLHFTRKWQQFTAPAMAKGFEDTALYVYYRLVSLNEVGGDPAGGGITVEEFHRWNLARRQRWPHALNATSTHDTKRSEDVRARLNVLSELPALWAEHFLRWQDFNRAKKPALNGSPVPDDNTERFIYQNLLGAWPLRREEEAEFLERFGAYLIKAAREAKIYTSWLRPQAAYEKSLIGFLKAIFEPPEKNLFVEDFQRLQRRVACFGAVNSLAQVLLKITAPGVPDFYQGSELWDFSLVDPDNRRPVDFRHRAALLESLQEQEKNGLAPLARELCAHWEDGRIKLYLTYRALNLRRGCQELFASGEYIPLHASGGLNSHVCAFARRLEKAWAVAAVPRLLARLLGEVQRKPAEESSHWPFPDGLLPGRQIWGKSEIILPAGAPGEWSNVFTGEALLACAHSGLNTTGAASPREKALPLADLFANFPVALLVSPLSRTS